MPTFCTVNSILMVTNTIQQSNSIKVTTPSVDMFDREALFIEVHRLSLMYVVRVRVRTNLGHSCCNTLSLHTG